MKHFFALTLIIAFVVAFSGNGQILLVTTPTHISFLTQDGGTIYADLYGKGERGVVLAHGGRFISGDSGRNLLQRLTVHLCQW